MSVPVRGTNCYDRTVMGHTPNRVDRLLIRTATAARAGMATTADISTRVHPAKGRGKRITGSRCHHQHQPWSIPLTDQPILTAHMCRYALHSHWGCGRVDRTVAPRRFSAKRLRHPLVSPPLGGRRLSLSAQLVTDFGPARPQLICHLTTGSCRLSRRGPRRGRGKRLPGVVPGLGSPHGRHRRRGGPRYRLPLWRRQ